MSATVGSLNVSATLQTAAFDRGLSHMQQGLNRAQQRFQALGQRLSGLGQTMSIGLTAPFTALMSQAIPAAIQSQQALGQVEAALSSMGPVAGRTSDQLQEAASRLQDISTFDDDDILRSVTANLLTFGNVSGEVFDRAQQSIVDIAARMGTDLQSATMQVGRALNDPIKGMNALARAGIQFTDAQKEQIKAMVAVGDTAGAQAIMLGELERQFGGAAKAMREATPGADLQQSWGEFQEKIGQVALQILPPLTAHLSSALDAFNNLSPAVQQTAVGAAAVAAAMGPVMMAVGPVLPLLTRLTPVVTALAGTAGLGALAVAAVGVVVAFRNWNEVATVTSNVAARLQDVSGATDRAAQQAEASRGRWDHLTSAPAFETNFWRRVEADLVGIGRRIQGVDSDLRAFDQATRAADAAIATFARNAWAAFEQLGTRAVAAMQRMAEGVHSWITTRLDAAWNWAAGKIRWIGDQFAWLHRVVVGNSYIPDMVEGIAAEMQRLDAVMVKPAQDAAARTALAFAGIAGPQITAPARGETDEAPQAGALGGLPMAAKSLSDTLQQLGPAAGTAFGSMAQSIASTALPAVQTLSDATSSLGQKLGAIGSLAQEVFGAIFGDKAGRIIGGLFNAGAQLFGGSFGGFRANGGPVVPGKSYIVGERGPEWFTPGWSGYITPNSDNGARGEREAVEVIVHTSPLLTAQIVQGDARATIGGASGGYSAVMRHSRRRLP